MMVDFCNYYSLDFKNTPLCDGSWTGVTPTYETGKQMEEKNKHTEK